jgi:hypothetical protein
MTEEHRLLERLRLIEALHAGAATPGERDAAANARERIKARLAALQNSDPPVEFSFKLRDRWSHRLLVALLRRYGIAPYRYRGQRYTTVMARLPKRFVNETLWPEFVELNGTLTNYIAEVTERVIAEGIGADSSEVEERPEPRELPAGTASNELGRDCAGHP